MSSLYARSILGPLEIGVIITAFLFGCAAIQAYVYYRRFTEDPWPFKALVAVVVAFEFAHLVGAISTLWTISITQFGVELVVLPLGGDMVVLFTTPICFAVQSFFTYRMWRLSKTVILPLFCFALSVLTFVVGLVLTAEGIRMSSLVDFEQSKSWLITLGNMLAVVCDTCITLGLAYFLNQKRSMSVSQQTNVINLLILWTVETGLITSLTALSVAICFLTMPSNFIWIGIYAIMGSVYANSLLAAMNGRWTARLHNDPEAYQLEGRGSRPASTSKPIVISVSQAIEYSRHPDSPKAGPQAQVSILPAMDV